MRSLARGITRQHAGLAELAAQAFVGDEQGTGDAEADGAGPTGAAAAVALDLGAEAVLHARGEERLFDQAALLVAREPLLGGLAVDLDRAVAGIEADAGDGVLAPAEAVVVVTACGHSLAPLSAMSSPAAIWPAWGWSGPA